MTFRFLNHATAEETKKFYKTQNEGEIHQKKKNHKTKQIQHFYKIKPNSENALHKDGKYLKLPLKLMW